MSLVCASIAGIAPNTMNVMGSNNHCNKIMAYAYGRDKDVGRGGRRVSDKPADTKRPIMARRINHCRVNGVF